VEAQSARETGLACSILKLKQGFIAGSAVGSPALVAHPKKKRESHAPTFFEF
jgi:hypothetical protein